MALNGSGMAQHGPVARIEALYRNEWPGSAIRRLCYAEGASSGHRICWLGGIIY